MFSKFRKFQPQYSYKIYSFKKRKSNGVFFLQLGIVGRTGSGKSSLFQVLFRMVHGYQGTVFLDGVNLASVPLDILRLVSTGLCRSLGFDHIS